MYQITRALEVLMMRTDRHLLVQSPLEIGGFTHRHLHLKGVNLKLFSFHPNNTFQDLAMDEAPRMSMRVGRGPQHNHCVVLGGEVLLVAAILAVQIPVVVEEYF